MKDKIQIFRDLWNNNRRLAVMLWHEKTGLLIGLSCFTTLSYISPLATAGALAVLINQLFQAVSNPAVTNLVWLWFGILVALRLVTSALSLLEDYFSRRLWFVLSEKFEMAILAKRGELDIAAHESVVASDLLNKIRENGVFRVQNFFEREISLLGNIVSVIVAAVALFSFAWWVLVILIVATVPELIIESLHGHQIWGMYDAKVESKRHWWATVQLFNEPASVSELKLFQTVDYFYQKARSLFQAFRHEQEKADRGKLIYQLWSFGVSQLAVMISVAWFVKQVMDGQLSVGALTFIMSAIGTMLAAAQSLFRNVGKQYADNLFVNDFFALLALQPFLARPSAPQKLTGETPELVFENVSFCYPGTDKLILDQINLTIPTGQKLALVGVNGAGKTTLLKLLCRFYDPTAGHILVDGIDLRQLDLSSFYQKLGLLAQDYNHYKLTVAQTIALGDIARPIDTKRVQQAAMQSGAAEFIEALPRGYDQQLGKNFDGIELSIGQQQKLALATIFYRQPQIFVLDEPTAAVDALAEEQIFVELTALPADRTVILISHRFSTVRRADQIVVLEDGKISEKGTHDELMILN